MEVVVGVVVLAVLLILNFVSGSNVDPDDNPIWDKQSTKARKRKAKLERLYATEIHICKVLKIDPSATYVQWYQSKGMHYINDVAINLYTVGKLHSEVDQTLCARYSHKGVCSKRLHKKEVLNMLGIGSMTYRELLIEGLI